MSNKTWTEIKGSQHLTERGHCSTLSLELTLTESTAEHGAGPVEFELACFDRANVGGAMSSFSVEIPAAPDGAAMTFTTKYSNDRKTWFDVNPTQDETGADQGGADVNVGAGAKEHFLVPFVDFPHVACMRYIAIFGFFQADPAGVAKKVKVYGTLV